MLPETGRAAEIVQVLGHRAAIWCDGKRTFVLVAKQPQQEVERLASMGSGVAEMIRAQECAVEDCR